MGEIPREGQEPPKKDWSRVEKIIEGMKDNKESDLELPIGGKAEEARRQLNKEHQKNLQIIKQQEYEKVVKQMQRFRAEHGIKKTPEELAKEDADLRKKFGIS